MTVPNLTPAAWAADAPAGSKLLPPKKCLLPKLDLIEMGISVWNPTGNRSINPSYFLVFCRVSLEITSETLLAFDRLPNLFLSYRVLHGFDIRTDVVGGSLPVLFQQLDDGRPDDHTIS